MALGEGRVAAHGLVESSYRIAKSRSTVNLYGRRLLRGPRVAIRHHHCDRLLQSQHIIEVRVFAQSIEKALLDGTRIPKHDPHAIGEKLLEQNVPAGLRGTLNSRH